MHKDGHVGVALLLYAPVVAVMSYHAEWLYPYALAGALAMVDLLWPVATLTGTSVTFSFAMIPDLDMKMPGVKHRGITHTVWFALFTGLVTAGLTYGIGAYVAGRAPQTLPRETLVVGTLFMGFVGAFSVVTHILGDAMTPMGVEPFAPLSDTNYTLDLWNADNSVANGLLLALGVVAVVVAFFVDDYVPLSSLPV